MRLPLIAALASLTVFAPPALASTQPPLVKTETGAVSGQIEGPARVFRAIPYAAPPIGALRWRPPLPATPWDGVRQAVTPGVACPQRVKPGIPNEGGYFGPTAEDCLTLDVTAPLRARKAPVMVWIYGGGNVAGATNLPSYDAKGFARDGVILVAMNYRLGALGFFAHPALTREARPDQPLANYGLMDQIAALQWVKRNIAAFGGDPDNVTLFGESAGGEDTLQLMATPAARSLFRRAIVQSGLGWEKPSSLTAAEARGATLMTRLGLSGDKTSIADMRAIAVDALIAAQASAGPIVDGRLVRQGPKSAFDQGEETPVPLIIGWNSNEASLLGPTDAGAEHFANLAPAEVKAAYGAESATPAALGRALFNDQVMGAPARWLAARHAPRGGAWLYYFSYVPERQRAVRPGTNHASEIPFVFDSLEAVPGRAGLITASERATASLTHACWVAFARGGRPDCAGGAWSPYSRPKDELYEFGDPSGARTHWRKVQLDAQDAWMEQKAKAGSGTR